MATNWKGLKEQNRLELMRLKANLSATVRDSFADTCYDVVNDHPREELGAPFSENYSWNQWTLSTTASGGDLRQASTTGLESYSSIDRGKWAFQLGVNLYFGNPIEYVPDLEKGNSRSAPTGFIEKNLPNFEKHFQKHAKQKGL